MEVKRQATRKKTLIFSTKSSVLHSTLTEKVGKRQFIATTSFRYAEAFRLDLAR